MHEQFHELAGDVAGLPRPAPSALRRTAERRRWVSRTLATATVLTLAAGTAAGVGQVLGAGDQVLENDRPAASSAPTPTAPPPARAWLPSPWTLVSSESYTLAEGEPSRYQFCGTAMVSSGPVTASEQVLTHPSGLRARLVEMTPTAGDAFQLFKFSYAACLAPGKAESIGGPRNVWSYGAVAGASEVADASLHVAELTGPSLQEAATRRAAGTALESWLTP